MPSLARRANRLNPAAKRFSHETSAPSTASMQWREPKSRVETKAQCGNHAVGAVASEPAAPAASPLPRGANVTSPVFQVGEVKRIRQRLHEAVVNGVAGPRPNETRAAHPGP